MPAIVRLALTTLSTLPSVTRPPLTRSTALSSERVSLVHLTCGKGWPHVLHSSCSASPSTRTRDFSEKCLTTAAAATYNHIIISVQTDGDNFYLHNKDTNRSTVSLWLIHQLILNSWPKICMHKMSTFRNSSSAECSSSMSICTIFTLHCVPTKWTTSWCDNFVKT